MKTLLGLLGALILATSPLSGETENNQQKKAKCQCKDCSCTEEKHCGCFAGGECTCTPETCENGKGCPCLITNDKKSTSS